MVGEELVLCLSDGTEVELVNSWVIDNNDSYSVVNIIDCENNDVIGSYRGELPDTEDEDFNVEELIEKVENILNGKG